jgi:hypothetical protein
MTLEELKQILDLIPNDTPINRARRRAIIKMITELTGTKK